MPVTSLAFPESAIANAVQLRQTDRKAFAAALIALAQQRNLPITAAMVKNGQVCIVRHLNGYIGVAATVTAAKDAAEAAAAAKTT